MRSLATLLLIALISCNRHTPTHLRKQEKINGIFSSEKFYLQHTQYGNFFEVKDSVAFHRVDTGIIAHFIHFGPYSLDTIPPKTLTTNEVDEIRNMLSDMPSKIKCYDFIALYNQTDTVLFIDTNCPDLIIYRVKKIIEAK